MPQNKMIISTSKLACCSHFRVFFQFRVYAAPDQINKTEYALNFGSRVLQYFENYFGIDYPLPKQGKYKFHNQSSIIILTRILHIYVIQMQRARTFSDYSLTSSTMQNGQ